METLKIQKQKEQRQTTAAVKLNTQGLWDNYKSFNMQVVGIPDGKERTRRNF